jgi:hypothetical protein
MPTEPTPEKGYHEYAFDITLNAVARVHATTVESARKHVVEHLSDLDSTDAAGLLKEPAESGVIVTAMGLTDEDPSCFLVDDAEKRRKTDAQANTH